MLSYSDNPQPCACPWVGMQRWVWRKKGRKGAVQRAMRTWAQVEKQPLCISTPCASPVRFFRQSHSVHLLTQMLVPNRGGCNILEGFRPGGLSYASDCNLGPCNPDNAELNQRCVGRSCFWRNLNQFLMNNSRIKGVIRKKVLDNLLAT